MTRDDALMPEWMPRFNKWPNRALRLVAPYVPPLAVIVHRGRRSGREYRTPVAAFRMGSSVAIGLPYGTNSDWVRNLIVEGRGGLEQLGRLHRITNPRIVSDPALLPGPMRLPARRMRFLLVDLADRSDAADRPGVTGRDESESGRSPQ
jgi:deazaflavin-dependent oxidoreductase (nitroreductase family)